MHLLEELEIDSIDTKVITEESLQEFEKLLFSYPEIEVCIQYKEPNDTVIYEEVEGMDYGWLWESYVEDGKLNKTLVKERLIILAELELKKHLEEVATITRFKTGEAQISTTFKHNPKEEMINADERVIITMSHKPIYEFDGYGSKEDFNKMEEK